MHNQLLDYYKLNVYIPVKRQTLINRNYLYRCVLMKRIVNNKLNDT